jgi:hypothetical protein
MADTRLVPDPGPPSPAGPAPGAPWHRRPWPAGLAGFLVGAALSGLVTGLMVAARSQPPRVVQTSPVPAPTTTAPADRSAAAAAGPCLEAADLAQRAIDRAGAGLRQLGRLDSTSLEQTIDELQRLRPRLEAASQACRARAGRG